MLEVDAAEELYYYKDIILAYKDLIESGNIFGDTPEAFQKVGFELMQSGLTNPYTGYANVSINDMYPEIYYGLYDINNDGVKELFISQENSETGEEMLYIRSFDIWTIYDEKACWLIAPMYRSYVRICENGIIEQYGSGGIFAHGVDYYKIENGELIRIDGYSALSDYEGGNEGSLITQYYTDYQETELLTEDDIVKMQETYVPTYADIQWENVNTLVDADAENMKLYGGLIEEYSSFFYGEHAYIEGQTVLSETLLGNEEAIKNMTLATEEYPKLYYGFADADYEGDNSNLVFTINPNESTTKIYTQDIWGYNRDAKIFYHVCQNQYRIFFKNSSLRDVYWESPDSTTLNLCTMMDIEYFALEVTAEEFKWDDREQYTYASCDQQGVIYSGVERYPFAGEVVQEMQWYLAE